jgi:hypothetical protein
MDTSNCKEQAKKQNNVVKKKKVKEEAAGNVNSSTGSVDSRSGPDYQICIPLGWAPW